MALSPSGAGPPPIPDAYAEALAGAGAATLGALQALEAALRRLHPPRIPALRSQLGPLRDRLEDALEAFAAAAVPEGLEAFHQELAGGAGAARDALARFLDRDPAAHPAAGILASMRGHAHAQELLYPLRLALPPLGRFFVEPAWHDRLAALDPEPPQGVRVGLFRGGGEEEEERGGFSLYVPERYRPDRAWPLVVALHGGSGTGRAFLWSWLREARGRGCLLLAPSSRAGTWALDAPHVEAAALARMVEFVAERWQVDRARILLSGLSDGATFTLLAGLLADAPYTALAPVSGVLHPACLALGNLARARGRRIYLVHGALDWMFPVQLARMARDALADAGADLCYREIEDLSHTYPREENAEILEWLDPALALG
jgi:phospholipase/carboxylesterase